MKLRLYIVVAALAAMGTQLVSTSAHAAAVVAPSKPSTIVTLGSTGSTCISGFHKLNQRLQSDGSSAAFTIPTGMVLVVERIDWAVSGAGADTLVLSELDIEGIGGSSPVLRDYAESNSAGAAGHSITFSGVPVKSVANLCWAASSGTPTTFSVHGFLAKDN